MKIKSKSASEDQVEEFSALSATFTDDFSKSKNDFLYEQMHPKGQLFAEGHDNNGDLPPISVSNVFPDSVMQDVLHAVRATA